MDSTNNNMTAPNPQQIQSRKERLNISMFFLRFFIPDIWQMSRWKRSIGRLTRFVFASFQHADSPRRQGSMVWKNKTETLFFFPSKSCYPEDPLRPIFRRTEKSPFGFLGQTPIGICSQWISLHGIKNDVHRNSGRQCLDRLVEQTDTFFTGHPCLPWFAAAKGR